MDATEDAKVCTKPWCGMPAITHPPVPSLFIIIHDHHNNVYIQLPLCHIPEPVANGIREGKFHYVSDCLNGTEEKEREKREERGKSEKKEQKKDIQPR